MTNKDRLKEIEDKWTHSRMDYADSKWLINRVHELTEALEFVANDLKSLHYVRARKALQDES